MYSEAKQLAIRQDIFRWLDEKLGAGAYELTRAELLTYSFEGERIPLLDIARGIRNPTNFESTLTIMTSVKDPYNDGTAADGYVRYAYQSRDGGDNVKLQRALETAAPLVYFKGIRPGFYAAHYPVTVVADDPVNKNFLIALDDSMTFFADPLSLSMNERRYAERLVRQRLHQPVFRARVMHAYGHSCTVCRLAHPELLDAAHIVGDTELEGIAEVPNGLSLCKIHHAAYDRNFMGITPDFEIRINGDLLNEVDGPMLRHGLQDMHGEKLTLPKRKSDAPSREKLALRWESFVA